MVVVVIGVVVDVCLKSLVLSVWMGFLTATFSLSCWFRLRGSNRSRLAFILRAVVSSIAGGCVGL